MDEEQSAAHFTYLVEELSSAGYEQYEISNFAKPGQYARHNSNYWKGVPYLGIGPSAHSFNGDTRQWNVSNNAKYIGALNQDELPYEIEELSEQDKFNEYIMTALRTQWGIDLEFVKKRFGLPYYQQLTQTLERFIDKEVVLGDGKVVLAASGKLMADHIASELFR